MKQSTQVKITATCDQCGTFEVTRKRCKRKSTCGRKYDVPQKVVCPKCRWHATVDQVEDI